VQILENLFNQILCISYGKIAQLKRIPIAPHFVNIVLIDELVTKILDILELKLLIFDPADILTMRNSLSLAIVCFLLVGAFCFQAIGQADYPAILTDSNALEEKVSYLKSIEGSQCECQQPNIIIILADDLGKNDITLYDSKGVETPNINRLAAEGVIFNEAYCTSSVCNPSRAGLLTGRYQQRFGNERQVMSRYARNKFEFFFFKHFINTWPMYQIEPWFSPPEEEMRKQGLPESEVSLFELLHAAGYRTGCIGKWHLGYNEPFLPQNKDIDEFYGFYEAFSLYAPKNNKDIVGYKHKIFQEKHIWRQERKGSCALVQNGTEIEEEEYLTFKIADEACRFIRESGSEPFMLYVPFNAPHTPFQAPQEYYDRFSHVGDRNKQVYYGMIAALDDAVGEILDQIKESGLEEKTMIFFTSDNGGATYTGATENGDLKGGKMTHFEGGLNVPFIMKWKDVLEPGMQYNEPVSLMDIFSTAAFTSHIMPPEDIQIDGVNLMPFLSGREPRPPHEYLFWRTDFNKTVRHGEWKLIVNDRDGHLLLYNLETDKQEMFNLEEEHPEIVKQMLAKFTEWEKSMIPPAWPSVMEYEQEINGVKMRFAF
jgi:arylsulfatase A-like enzyme